MAKPIFHTKEELADYYHFVVKSSNDALRLEKAWAMYLMNYKGDGCMGCIDEVLNASSGSKKVTVSNAGKNDNYISYRSVSGKVVPVYCESKRNGGRIETIETEFSKAEKMIGKYVIYRMDVCNSGTNYVRRHVDPVVIPRKLFVSKLYELNAVKAINKNGVLNGFGIQVTCKPFYLWLCDWPIVYDRNKVYSDDDFEGLE